MSKREFEKFYNNHLDKVYRFVFFRCNGNRELTEDLVSEIFMKALEHFDSYDEKVSKSAWIMTITRNHLANYWRDSKKTSLLPEDEDREDQEGTGDGFWLAAAKHIFEKEKSQSEVYELLAKIEPAEAELVTFHYILGYSYAEIGELKGQTEGAVKVAAHRALKKLRSLL